jgi:hypothetical protein
VSSETAVLAAARDGDETAFTALTERYRRRLIFHCYRKLSPSTRSRGPGPDGKKGSHGQRSLCAVALNS